MYVPLCIVVSHLKFAHRRLLKALTILAAQGVTGRSSCSIASVFIALSRDGSGSIALNYQANSRVLSCLRTCAAVEGVSLRLLGMVAHDC